MKRRKQIDIRSKTGSRSVAHGIDEMYDKGISMAWLVVITKMYNILPHSSRYHFPPAQQVLPLNELPDCAYRLTIIVVHFIGKELLRIAKALRRIFQKLTR